MKCSKCGTKLKNKYNLCPICGEKFEKEEKKKSKKFLIIIFFMIIIIGIGFIFYFNKNKYNVEELKKSVVLIYVYDENEELYSTGSGVIAFKDDIVLTNAHVVEGNYKIEVISENNTKYNVKGIIAYNKTKDIALLKLENSRELKAVSIKTKIKTGDEVCAIGSPLGLKNTVSTGIISGMFQDNIEVYQHTAPISSGSSGGALFDSQGNLVGITYASLTEGQNLNLAIPIEYYQNIYNNSKNNVAINTRFYKLLSNKILKTEYGTELVNYILNDEFSNEKWKSGETTIEKQKRGYFNYSTNFLKSYLVSEENYDEIKDYIDSELWIYSGVEESLGLYDIKSGEYYDDNWKWEENGYGMVIIKLNKNEQIAINKVKEFILNEFEYKDDQILNNGIYVYALYNGNYTNFNKVEEIVNKLVNQ